MQHSMIGNSTPQFYTVAQTAELLKISRSGLYRLLRLSIIRGVRVGGLLRVPATELNRIANSSHH